MLANVEDMKNQKARIEGEIETLKSKIIREKNEFYETNENYHKVEQKYKVLDTLFNDKTKECDTQLLHLIQKVFGKIVSKRIDLGIQHNDRWGSHNSLGLNNNGIGTIRTRSWRNTVRMNTITDLETLLTIVKNEDIINKIKSVIHKAEKKEMLDVLHEKLKDWEIGKENDKMIGVSNRKIRTQKYEGGWGDGEKWNVKYNVYTPSSIKISFILDRTETKIDMRLKSNNEDYHLYHSNYKESSYNDYDYQDMVYASCQVWDILEPYVDEIIKKFGNANQIKEKTLKEIFDRISPYLMVDAI